MIEERKAEITPSLEEIRACQEKMIMASRGLQILGYIRPGKRRPTAKQFERTVSESAEKLIDRREHSSSWTPQRRDLQVLLPYLAKIVRDGGVDAAQEAFREVDDPVFVEGLRLLDQSLSRMDFEDAFEKAWKKQMTEESKRRGEIFQMLLAIHDGEEPRKVAEILAER
jgi:hypothetical protein